MKVDSQSSSPSLQSSGAEPEEQTVPASKPPRLCQECEEPIPTARLKAMPSARLCVPCLEKAGDVPIIRRYDEAGVDGDTAQTYYVNNRDIERERLRRSNATGTARFVEADEPDALDLDSVSVGAMNLGSAAEQREAELHRAACRLRQEQSELRKTA